MHPFPRSTTFNRLVHGAQSISVCVGGGVCVCMSMCLYRWVVVGKIKTFKSVRGDVSLTVFQYCGYESVCVSLTAGVWVYLCECEHVYVHVYMGGSAWVPACACEHICARAQT